MRKANSVQVLNERVVYVSKISQNNDAHYNFPSETELLAKIAEILDTHLTKADIKDLVLSIEENPALLAIINAIESKVDPDFKSTENKANAVGSSHLAQTECMDSQGKIGPEVINAAIVDIVKLLGNDSFFGLVSNILQELNEDYANGNGDF